MYVKSCTARRFARYARFAPGGINLAHRFVLLTTVPTGAPPPNCICQVAPLHLALHPPLQSKHQSNGSTIDCILCSMFSKAYNLLGAGPGPLQPVLQERHGSAGPEAWATRVPAAPPAACPEGPATAAA